jgi:putative pyruvate formate lyase activating enzyme
VLALEKGRARVHARQIEVAGEPSYLRLHRSGELRARAQAAMASLARCKLCPHACGTDRLAGCKAYAGPAPNR